MNKLLTIAFAVLVGSIGGTSAQTYPDRAIKLVVPYPAGGPTDTVARTVTQGLSVDLGQSVIIENQAGAGGRIALKTVARAAPDGYTLLVGGTNNNAITPALYKDLDFDAEVLAALRPYRARRRTGDDLFLGCANSCTL